MPADRPPRPRRRKVRVPRVLRRPADGSSNRTATALSPHGFSSTWQRSVASTRSSPMRRAGSQTRGPDSRWWRRNSKNSLHHTSATCASVGSAQQYQGSSRYGIVARGIRSKFSKRQPGQFCDLSKNLASRAGLLLTLVHQTKHAAAQADPLRGPDASTDKPAIWDRTDRRANPVKFQQTATRK